MKFPSSHFSPSAYLTNYSPFLFHHRITPWITTKAISIWKLVEVFPQKDLLKILYPGSCGLYIYYAARCGRNRNTFCHLGPETETPAATFLSHSGVPEFPLSRFASISWSIPRLIMIKAGRNRVKSPVRRQKYPWLSVHFHFADGNRRNIRQLFPGYHVKQLPALSTEFQPYFNSQSPLLTCHLLAFRSLPSLNSYISRD